MPEDNGSPRGLLYPPTIPYELQVQCNGRITRRSQGSLDLNDADGYLNIETKACEFVREDCKEPLDAYHIHFRGGHCIETRDNNNTQQWAIADQTQWKSMCNKLLKDFGDGQIRRCTLLISRDYSAFELRPTDFDRYEDVFVNNKAFELRSLMKTSISGKDYLPKIDLDGFTSPPVIRAVIYHSDRLKDLTEARREELIRDIDIGAKKLFTVFILNRFGMHCLDKLLREGYRDDNLPKRHKDEPYACCRSHNDQHNALPEQMRAFSAFNFEAQGHFVLEPNCVVPILPVAVDRSQRSSDLSPGPTIATYDGQDNR